jgi:hypothetical protein
MAEFTRNDWDHFHDVLVDATGDSYSPRELQRIFDQLPAALRYDAQAYGMNDTGWRDSVYEWLEGNVIAW